VRAVKLRTLREMLRDAPLLVRAMRTTREVQRAAFLAGAGGAGVLARLGRGAATLDELAAIAGTPADERAALAAWLDAGITLREIARDGDRYRLRGALARGLARPASDALLAIVESAVTLHRQVLLEAPDRIRYREQLTLADLDPERVARASRLSEPLLREAIDEVVPAAGACSLLEVGCGDAAHVHYAARRNPALRALAIDLDEEVVARARDATRLAGLAERVEVACADVRDFRPSTPFDVATLHQNVYYFPLEERVALFERLRAALRPGGRLLVTSVCRGGSMVAAVLDVWGRITEGCGPIPEPAELVGQLARAGFHDASARNLLPGDRFFRFVASA